MPLRLEDFRQLAPGERFDPTAARGGAAYLPLSGFANCTPTDVGRSEIRLQLSTEREKPRVAGYVRLAGEAQVIERLKAVPRVRVESNTLVLEGVKRLPN